MRFRFLTLATALCAAGLSAAPSGGTLAVGQVLDDSMGKSVNGWLHMQGSMYTTRSTKNSVTTETQACCVAVLKRGTSYIVARTEVMARNPTGGVIKERIASLRRIDARPGEDLIDCSLFSLNLALSLKNEKTRMVRSVVVDDGGLAVIEWKDTDGRCSLGD
ncbi:MAG: hypothetical protein J0M19_04670 [Sphingomonadales bacterium]|nr:hypothetical protein [Sphingomonadales bacterium]